MLKNVIAVRRDGVYVRLSSIIFEVPNREFDLLSAMKSAAEDYCRTEEGKNVFIDNFDEFNVSDFQDHVPDEICEKYGFRRVKDSLNDEIVDWDMSLVDELEDEE